VNFDGEIKSKRLAEGRANAAAVLILCVTSHANRRSVIATPLREGNANA
jgi:hypothetical protein